MTVRHIFDAVPIATKRKQISKAVHGLTTSGVAEKTGIDAETGLVLYVITDKGRERLAELLGAPPQPKPAKTPEAELIRRVQEAEPVQPWEIYDSNTDPIARDIDRIQFSADNELFRKGREHAGRLRYLAQRLESIRTTEGNNIAANLRETADLIDMLVPSDA